MRGILGLLLRESGLGGLQTGKVRHKRLFLRRQRVIGGAGGGDGRFVRQGDVLRVGKLRDQRLDLRRGNLRQRRGQDACVRDERLLRVGQGVIHRLDLLHARRVRSGQTVDGLERLDGAGHGGCGNLVGIIFVHSRRQGGHGGGAGLPVRVVSADAVGIGDADGQRRFVGIAAGRQALGQRGKVLIEPCPLSVALGKDGDSTLDGVGDRLNGGSAGLVPRQDGGAAVALGRGQLRDGIEAGRKVDDFAVLRAEEAEPDLGVIAGAVFGTVHGQPEVGVDIAVAAVFQLAVAFVDTGKVAVVGRIAADHARLEQRRGLAEEDVGIERRAVIEGAVADAGQRRR